MQLVGYPDVRWDENGIPGSSQNVGEGPHVKPLRVGDECPWEEVQTDEGCETGGLNGGEGRIVEYPRLGPIQ